MTLCKHASLTLNLSTVIEYVWLGASVKGQVTLLALIIGVCSPSVRPYNRRSVSGAVDINVFIRFIIVKVGA
jgi:hypothetical protein